MKILRFNESKKTKKEELDGISTFDVKSLEPTKDDLVGFVSDYEEVKDKDIKKVKKEIEVTTPGLKNSIKKFEDFSITIEMGDDNSAESTFDTSNPFSGAINSNEEECCSDCQCDPCECDGGECEVDNIESKEGCGCCDECTGQSDCECCEQCSCGQMEEQPMEQPKVMNITDFISSIIGQR
jgi:hypothetical protein